MFTFEKVKFIIALKWKGNSNILKIVTKSEVIMLFKKSIL